MNLLVWDDTVKAYKPYGEGFEKFTQKRGEEFGKIIEQIKNEVPAPLYSFALDGALDIEKYKSQEERLLFLLKEAYDSSIEDKKGDGNLYAWDELSWVQNNIETISNPTWRRIFQWSNLILNGKNEVYISSDVKRGLLNRIAVVNINKFNGENPSSDKKFRNLLKNNAVKESIKNQIKLFKPTIIVCGHTGWILDIVLDKALLKHRNPYWKYKYRFDGLDNDTAVIDFWHPANTNSDQALLDDWETIKQGLDKQLRTKKHNFENTIKE